MARISTRVQHLLTILLVAAVASACVIKRDVYKTTDGIFKKVEGFKESAYICAPKEYAHTQAHSLFARTEADYGDTMRAKDHLEQAQLWYGKLYKATHTPAGAIREGCEGDSDDDSILNSKDRCPQEPEDYDGDQDTDGCPEWDKDGDGIPDDKDQCPADAEDKDGFEDADGCPDKDNDLDGIPDDKDKCPNQPEDFDQFQDSDGCPEADNDGDGIPDIKDKCPLDPEDFDGDQDDDGCPDLYKSIIIKEDKIELKQKVFFKFNKAKIMPQSYDMLKEVADALVQNPTIKISIEGHTDSKGRDRYNKKLSDQRAKSVRQFLVKNGVAPDHMVAIGYGEERPIADNDTEEGRDMNRRVEFNIIER